MKPFRQRAKKPLTKEAIINALEKTKTAPSAARYLGCSYSHLRKWMKIYDSQTHDNLFEQYNNRGAKGVKRMNHMTHEPKLLDLLDGIYDIKKYPISRIRYRLCEEGYLEEICGGCGFCERRESDYKMPLILVFLDGDKKNWKVENLSLRCYNCYFMNFGEVFNERDMELFESFTPARGRLSENSMLEKDEYFFENMDELKRIEEEKKTKFNDFDIIAYKHEKDKAKIKET